MREAGLIRHAANESKGVVPREGEFYRFAASVTSPPAVDGAGAPALGV
jgi:carbonic anhydrase